MILQIDGLSYDVKCELTRTFTVNDSDISGKMMNGTYFHDVDGTYLEYEITFKYPLWNQAKYADIIGKLNEPVASHMFVLPYDQETITLAAKVEPIADDLLELENGAQYWRNTSFTITSIAPIKSPTLAGAVSRGMPPVPTISDPTIGATYTWTGSAWVSVEDGDDIAY